jgi:hypothetical protein
MAMTAAQKEAYALARSREYIPTPALESCRQRLLQDGNLQTFRFAFEDFEPAECPACGASGAFRFHFLGRLVHPDCATTWYVKPGTYASAQLKRAFRAGASAAGGMADQAETKGGATAAGVFGFIVGALFRSAVALVLIPIQALVSLNQKRPERKQGMPA